MFSGKAGKSFLLVMILTSFVVILMAVLGCICFGKNGWYPMWEDTIPVMIGNTSSNYIQRKDSFAFMFNDGISIIPDAVMILAAYILGSIKNLSTNRFRAILGLVVLVAVGGFMGFGAINPTFAGSSTDTTSIMAFTLLACIPVMIFCFAKTTGGWYMLFGIGGFLVKNLLIPVIMWFAMLSVPSKIAVLIGVAVYVFLMVGNTGKLFGAVFGNGESSASTTDSDKKNKKAQERYSMLEKRVNDCKKGIKGHREGSWNYSHVDEKYTQKVIDRDLQEMESLRKSLS